MRVRGGLARLRSTLEFDAAQLTPVRGIITAIPLVVVFATCLALGFPRAAISMAIGANLIAIISVSGAPRPPIKIAGIDALVMGLSVTVGALSANVTALHLSILVVWCLAAGLLSSLGPIQSVVGTQAIIAFVLLGRIGASPLESVVLGVLVTLGAGIEILALVILRLPPSLRVQRRHLAECYDALAELCQQDPALASIDATVVLDRAGAVLARRSLLGRVDGRDLQAVFDEARRMRIEIVAIQGLRSRLEAAGRPARDAPDARGDEIAGWMMAAGDQLADIAGLLRGGRGERQTTPVLAVPGPDAHAGAHDDAGALLAEETRIRLEALSGQLRAARALACRQGSFGETPRDLTGRAEARPLRSARDDLEILSDAARSDSPARRHAIRLAVAVPSSLLVATVLGLPRGYWVAYAVAVVLKPDYSDTFSKGITRVVGTLIGATIAAGVLGAIHPSDAQLVLFAGLCAVAAYATWAASFAVGVGFMTALVLIVLAAALSASPINALDRFIDVSIGALIAFFAYRVWPTPSGPTVNRAIAQLFGAQRTYLSRVLDLLQGDEVAHAEIVSLAKASRLAWGRADAALGRSIDEPESTRADTSMARGLMAVALRVVRVNHAVRTGVDRGERCEPSPALDALRHGSLDALTELVEALEGDLEVVPTWTPSPTEHRARCAALDAALAREGAPASIGLHLDELVDALNTARHLIHPASVA